MSRVTLVFPVYNAEPYIERSLRSALDQTFDDIEYLVFDDHGRCESMEIVRRLLATHSRRDKVRLIDNVTNRGISYVRNKAIELATSPYLMYMDSDDVLTADCIETFYNTMCERHVDFIAASVSNVHENGTTTTTDLPDRLLTDNRSIVGFNIATPIYIMTWNKLYDVDFLRTNNIECVIGQAGEDDAFTFQIICRAQSCRLLSQITYDHMFNGLSLTGGYRRRGLGTDVADLYLSIVDFKKHYITTHDVLQRQRIFDFMVVSDAMFRCFGIIGSHVLDSRQKRHYIKSMLDFSTTPRDMLDAASLRSRIIIAMGRLPYPITYIALAALKIVKRR